jgi:hypothetical protein
LTFSARADELQRSKIMAKMHLRSAHFAGLFESAKGSLNLLNWFHRIRRINS